MCGISLIISGVHIVSSSSNLLNGFQHADFGSSLQEEKWASGTLYPTVDDLKEVVSRRGPDHVGLERLQLKVVTGHGPDFRKAELRVENICLLDETSCRSSEVNENSENQTAYSRMNKIKSSSQEHTSNYLACSCDTYQAKKSYVVANFVNEISGQTIQAFQKNALAEMLFVGATLQLRGVDPVFQPLVDSWMNILVYNGEVFGGILVGEEENDTTVLMNALERCCSCPCHAGSRDCHCCHQKDHISVPELLSTIKGPWALIYWQAKSNIVWFGRDAFGRRSLIIHWPSLNDSRLLLSSVAPFKTDKKSGCGSCVHRGVQSPDYLQEKEVDDSDDLEYWDELACGIYSISLATAKGFGYHGKGSCLSIGGRVEKHDWSNPQLKKLLNWERNFVHPGLSDSLMSNLTCEIGNGNFNCKENGLISSVIEQKDVNLGYVEFFDPSPMKGRFAPEVNQENKKIFTEILQGNHLLTKDAILNQVSSLKGMATQTLQDSFTCSAQRVLFALKQAVIRRACHSQINQIGEGGKSIGKQVPIAVLFSGGLDSMVLAALLDQCLNHNCEIDLLNVSFDGPHAPDRISAKTGVIELQRITPSRRWRLVEIDADPSNLQPVTKYLTSLIHPAKTYMDLNIGTALWLAAGGDGWVEEEESHQEEDENCYNDSYLLPTGHNKFKRIKYKSEARILFVGSGADEQCAGYGRHRTKFQLGGWFALQEEMKIDVQRIWKRNLGRDDRCIADHAKETLKNPRAKVIRRFFDGWHKYWD